jgi:glutathione S-transferase
MDELYQAEWCPHSRRVRQRFTELGVSYIARQIPAEPADREELRRKTGSDEIPALVLENGNVINEGADEIIAHLDRQYRERADAEHHRERADAEHHRERPDAEHHRERPERLSGQREAGGIDC